VERSGVSARRHAVRSAAGGPRAALAAADWTATVGAPAVRAAGVWATAVWATAVWAAGAGVSVRPVPPRWTEVLLVPGDVSREVFPDSLLSGRRESQTGARSGSGPDRVRAMAESRLPRVCVVS
jgi:hypothetical protein